VPGFGAVIFRRTSPQITNEGGLWDTSEELLQDIAKPREGLLDWEFPNGNKFKFAHMQYEKDKLNWQGAQIPAIGWDELTHFSESQFWYLVSRNRSVCGVTPYIAATCNPVSKEDPVGGWVRRLLEWWIGPDGYVIPERSGIIRWFIRVAGELVWGDSAEELKAQYPRSLPKSITFIESKLEDNVILETTNPEYRANLEALPEFERQQLLDRNWNAIPEKGSLFKDVTFERIRPSQVPELLEIRAIVDPAVTSTDNSDCQGVVIDGISPNRQTLYALYSWEGIIDPVEVVKLVIRKSLQFRATSITFETNQGGDLWKSTYKFVWQEMLRDEEIDPDQEMLAYYEIKQSGATGSKLERWNVLKGHYQAGRIKHVIGTHEVRERALKRVPEFTPYDLADASEMSARSMLRIKKEHKPAKSSSRDY
jgi:hypothetical protein